MSKHRLSEAQLRDIRKEMLRARAQVERHDLGRRSRRLGEELTPGALLRSVVPSGFTSKRPTDWLLEGASVVRRYPYLLSAASTVFSGLRRRRRLWRIGAGLLVSWALTRTGRSKSEWDEHA